MYMAMTRFQVILGQESLFESVWKKRKSYLHEMKGYRGLFLLRGETTSEHTVYMSHFVWNTKEDFEAWTKSEQFIKAHLQFGDVKALFTCQPVFESFSVVLQERPENKRNKKT